MFGPSIPSLLFLDRCSFGSFICRLLHLLDPPSQWMCSQNTMALSQCSGEMSTSGCLSYWYLLSAICVISFGNSKCLIPCRYCQFIQKSSIAQRECIVLFLTILSRKFKSTIYLITDPVWIVSDKLSIRSVGYSVSREIVVTPSLKTTVIKPKLSVFMIPLNKNLKVKLFFCSNIYSSYYFTYKYNTLKIKLLSFCPC